ncbi:hypothetical protein ACFQV2_03210 [Actinokineospora soli]|uniref:Uncharacterized protein n=1 Tax=Actinokineospora soli TaxID=1048753 RepID=A0ABW2TGF6_9PSEU
MRRSTSANRAARRWSFSARTASSSSSQAGVGSRRTRSVSVTSAMRAAWAGRGHLVVVGGGVAEGG